MEKKKTVPADDSIKAIFDQTKYFPKHKYLDGDPDGSEHRLLIERYLAPLKEEKSPSK